MNKKSGKYTKSELAYIAASKKIRLESDPAALVLASQILNNYEPEEKNLEYLYFDIALIDLVPGRAEAVINNTAELVNRVDHRFSFVFYDLNLENEASPKEKVIKLVNEMHNASELNLLTVHVIWNMSERFYQKDIIAVFQDLYIEWNTLHCIFIFDESSYYRFCDELIYTSELRPMWLHRLPGEIDIYYKSQKHSIDKVCRKTINPDIFTQCAKVFMNRALRQSILYEDDEIDYESLLRAAAEGVESSEALSQCLNLTPEKVHSLRNGLKEERVSGSCPGIYNLDTIDESAEKVIRIAMKMASASGYPDPEHLGLISAFHLIGALSMCEDIKKDLGTNRGIALKQAVNKIADWYFDVKHFSSLGNNQNAIRQIGFCQSQHRTMIGNIFGQNEALNMVNEAFSLDYFTYFSGHQVSKMPTVFLFIGPDSVGKGYFARLLAETYSMELQYYNLLFYAEGQSLPVKKRKKSLSPGMLVFENVAASQPAVIDELCQLIESGKVIDKESGEELNFSNSVIVIIAASDTELELIKEEHLDDRLIVHQDAVLNSLTHLMDRVNRHPLLPAKLISLLKKHQVIVFKKLQHEDLLNICERKLTQFSTAIEASGAKRLTFHPLIPYIILLSEGGKPKPSAISSAVEMLISAEVRKFITGYDESSAKDLLTEYDRLHFAIDDRQQMNLEVALHFNAEKKPKVLLLTERTAANYFSAQFRCAQWHPVSTLDALEDCIESDDYDYYLLDMWFSIGGNNPLKKAIIDEFYLASGRGKTTLPLSVIASKLFGESFLHITKSKLAHKPVVLFNRIDDLWNDNVVDYQKRPSSFYIEAADELRFIRENYSTAYPVFADAFRYDFFLELLESNYILGIINTEITGSNKVLSEEQKECFTDCIANIHQRLHRKKMAAELHKRKQRLTFTPQWVLCEQEGLINVSLSDLRIIENRFYDQQ